MKVIVQCIGQSVSKVGGDRGVGLAKEFSGSVGGGSKGIDDKRVDNLGV